MKQETDFKQVIKPASKEYRNRFKSTQDTDQKLNEKTA